MKALNPTAAWAARLQYLESDCWKKRSLTTSRSLPLTPRAICPTCCCSFRNCGLRISAPGSILRMPWPGVGPWTSMLPTRPACGAGAWRTGARGPIESNAFQAVPIRIYPKTTDMNIELFMLVWMPFRRSAKGQLSQDWR